MIPLKMEPFLMFGYVAAAMGFYRYIHETAPVIEEEESYQCKIYELFPEEQEIQKAA